MTESSRENIAAQWALKQQNGAMTEMDRQSFTVWLNESDEHRVIFEKTQLILDMTGRASDIADEDVLDMEFVAAVDNTRTSEFEWRRAAPLIAASAALVFVAAIVFLSGKTSEPTFLATAKGERIEFDLSDGSRATLNTASQIEVDVSEAQRRVSVDRGEVYFDVTPDPSRPFVVAASDIEIIVVGTKFNVQTIVGVTKVSVVSGVVQIDLNDNVKQKANTSEGELISLRAGDQLIYEASTETVNIRSFDTQRVGAWLNGHAIYDGQPLEYVVTDLNRYFPKRLELGDPLLSNIPVSGTFDLTDPAATIDGLTIALSLQKIQTNSGAIRLFPEDRQNTNSQE